MTIYSGSKDEFYLGGLLQPMAGYPCVSQEFVFIESTGAGVYTATCNIPSASTILDIKIRSTSLWTASTSATLNVGDGNSASGWFSGVNLKATDLLVGEELNFVQTGGKEGAYLSLATGARTVGYNSGSYALLAVVTTVGTTGNAGVTRMTVIYSAPNAYTQASKV